MDLAKGKGKMARMRARAAYAAYAIIAMYFFFMILDRLLSLIFGYNFQPYGSYVPPGFTLWGHLFNGALALFGVWLWLKLLELAGRSKHRWIFSLAVSAVTLTPMFLIPYNNDADHLIKHGSGGVIPWYVLANVAYVAVAGVVTLKLVKATKWRLAFLLALFAAFLLIHFLLYAPMFPEFQWT
ncbi:MAG: hypothetical protein ABH852_03670 [Methanobacteriota archaeon]